jgi:hypothetical protein
MEQTSERGGEERISLSDSLERQVGGGSDEAVITQPLPRDAQP